jgi:hypothetical protein
MTETSPPAPATWVADACTLPTAERPLRLAEFDDLFAGSVRAVDRVDRRRLRFTLDPAPEVAARAADLVVRESECCSFFTFTLTASGGQVHLDVAVPDGPPVEVLDALADRAVAEAAS